MVTFSFISVAGDNKDILFNMLVGAVIAFVISKWSDKKITDNIKETEE